MKVRSFRAPRRVVASFAQARAILRGCWSIFRRSKLLALGTFIWAMGLGILIFPHDRSLLETVHFLPIDRSDTARSIAWYLGIWGDYPTYNLPLALLIWLYGAATKNQRWCRVALVCFLGATMAGFFDDIFRLSLGRARPDTHLPDRFYGITYAFSGGFQSFPSGHAAAVFGTAVALIVTDLPLGILTTLFAFGVIWARVELYRHYPSDVVSGAVIGIYFGLLSGYGAKVRRAMPPLDSRPGST
jgi:membrane-associated phospholipid phosphatase